LGFWRRAVLQLGRRRFTTPSLARLALLQTSKPRKLSPQNFIFEVSKAESLQSKLLEAFFPKTENSLSGTS